MNEGVLVLMYDLHGKLNTYPKTNLFLELEYIYRKSSPLL